MATAPLADRPDLPLGAPGEAPQRAPGAAPLTVAQALAQQVTRRRLIAGMGVAAAAAGAAGLGLPVVTAAANGQRAGGARGHGPGAEADLAQHQWVMVFDLRRCDGCGECTEGCNEMHYLHADQPWIPVYTRKSSAGQQFYLPVLCQACEDPPCTKVCPVTATYRTADGITVVDQSICIGCRMCLAACPYGVRTFNWDPPLPTPTSLTGPSPEFPVPQQLGTAGKCVMCVHNLRVGKFPACVESCGMDAIYVGDLVSDVMTNGTETYRMSSYLRENDAFRLREELNTRPRVYYVAGHGQDLTF